MLIVDGHLDLAMNALQGNRDLAVSAYTTRITEAGNPGKGQPQGTVELPDMRQGRVALSFVTVIARSTGRPVAHIDFASPVQAYAIAQSQLAYYRALERGSRARRRGHPAGWPPRRRCYQLLCRPGPPPEGACFSPGQMK